MVYRILLNLFDVNFRSSANIVTIWSGLGLGPPTFCDASAALVRRYHVEVVAAQLSSSGARSSGSGGGGGGGTRSPLPRHAPRAPAHRAAEVPRGRRRSRLLKHLKIGSKLVMLQSAVTIAAAAKRLAAAQAEAAEDALTANVAAKLAVSKAALAKTASALREASANSRAYVAAAATVDQIPCVICISERGLASFRLR